MTVRPGQADHACPCCEGTHSQALGPIRETHAVIRLVDPGSLYRCPDCRLLYRYPYLSPEELARRYAALPVDQWSGEGMDRPDWDVARHAVTTLVRHCDVIEVGCFRGEFLRSLPAGYGRYGLELSTEASRTAAAAGIEMLGGTVPDALATGKRFGCVVAIDVVEHMQDPLAFLRGCLELLEPGGLCVMTTGDPSSWLWRWNPRDYWYYSPEHVSFCGGDWWQWASQHLIARIVHRRRFRRKRATPGQLAGMAMRTAVYEIAQAARRAGGPAALLRHVPPFSLGWVRPVQPDGWWTRDHHVVVLSAPAEPRKAA